MFFCCFLLSRRPPRSTRSDPLFAVTARVRYVGGVLRGDLCWSGVVSAPGTEVFPTKLAATVELAVASGSVAVALGISLGTFAGARRNRLPDHVIRVVAISGASMPLFWFAILLLIVFWVNLRWFPIGRSDPVIFGSITHPTGEIGRAHV